jgi:sulfonate transport system substrate-binding protein
MIKFLGYWLAALVALPLAVAEPAAAGGVIRIGFQKSGVPLLVKSQGTLEKELAPLGWRVAWKEFPSGPPLLEALNAGSIDFGHSGDAPLILAQSAGIPFVYVGSTAPGSPCTGILVPANSTVRTVAELKGRKVAFTKGSSSHYLVAHALKKAGLQLSDVTVVNLGPAEARAALESGSIDAWAVWDPFMAAAEVDAHARVLINGEGLQSHREIYFARRDFAEKNPAIIAAVLANLRETGVRALADPKGTAAFLAEKLGISLPVMELSEGRKKRYGAEPFTAKAAAEQQDVADLFFEQGLIPARLRVSDVIFSPPPAGKPSPAR